MPAGRPHYPDPGIAHGVFRVLPVTTGGFVVYDPRRAPAKRQVGPVFKRLEDADYAARTWHEQGHG
jgi:hypothetical protein